LSGGREGVLREAAAAVPGPLTLRASRARPNRARSITGRGGGGGRAPPGAPPSPGGGRRRRGARTRCAGARGRRRPRGRRAPPPPPLPPPPVSALQSRPRRTHRNRDPSLQVVYGNGVAVPNGGGRGGRRRR